ncbi:MAG: GNAT family N-acetyltransferase [Planctomycetaceae bacterium]|nr:GNAT family N-acetyltransferase [Planctomycetaceae bacterium]
MPSRFVKRNQMVFDFARTPAAEPQLPAGFFFVNWSPSLVDPHADVLHRSFRNDLDGTVFTTFRQYGHCRRLIELVSVNPHFLPAATLLIARNGADQKQEYVANIQGLKLSAEIGAIQNVAVLPEYRRQGIGQALVQGALQGFRQAGVCRVTLEATADNFPAAKLYHRIGFTTFRTYFREIFDWNP